MENFSLEMQWEVFLMRNSGLRKVGRDTVGDIDVSTMYVPYVGYETCLFNRGESEVVERYTLREDAEIGHQRWCQNLEIAGKDFRFAVHERED